jgi:hypothetical protein
MRRTILRLLSSFRSRGAERELTREIRSHLQLLEDQYVARGMDREEARYAALRAFGGVEQVKEQQRDARMFRWLAGWPMDLKLGGRMLLKYPGLTVVGGVAMAFAIWAGVVIFQVVSLLISPTLPVSQGARLVEVRSFDVAANVQEQKVLHDFLEWQQSLRSLAEVGAWRDSSRNLVLDAGDARPVKVAEMSVSGFRVADGEPLIGRVLVEGDEQPAAPAVAVLGYDVWRRRFGSDPNVLGRAVQLGNEYATVVGVMREGFEFPVSHDVWLPLKTAVLDRAPRSGPAISLFALLAPGETLQTAQAELTTAGRRAATELPATHQHLEPRVRPYAMMMVAEALVLGGAAAIVGVTAADVALRTWGMVFLETNLGRLPFWFDLGLSPRAIVVAIVLTLAGAAMAGIMPALKITRGIGHRLKETTAGSGGLQFGGVWTVVIVAQVAATVMFPAVVYMEQSLLRGVRDFDPGFANERYLTVQIERDYPVDGGANADAATRERNARLAATLEELRRGVAAQAGVGGVTFAERLPTTNHPQKVIELGYELDAGAPASAGGANTEPPARVATIAAVAPSYFDVLDAPVLAGRGFTTADAVPGTRVAIVDHGFVDQVLQGRNAVGQQVRFRYPGPSSQPWAPGNSDDPAGPGDWYEVIGVVRELGVGAPTQAGRAAGFYIPATPDLFDQIQMMVHVRGGDPMTLAPQVRAVATTVDPSLRLVNVQRANEVNNDVLWVMGLWLRITVVLSAVALILSLAGIFAVLSFTVARRTREIGVRVALGASRQRVVIATFRRPLFQVALGVVVGTAIIFSAAMVMKHTEWPGAENGLTLQGMAMIVGYGIVMLGVCMLGCVVPTRRALNIEPTTALRTE